MATIFNPATKGSRLHRTKMIGRRFGQIRTRQGTVASSRAGLARRSASKCSRGARG
jgi:hypothetical protein